MDVTPQVINEVEFHQKMRGYDPDEVDDFLERVAVAVGQLHDRTVAADERAAAADKRITELEHRLREVASRPAVDHDEETETIRRTLVLAQRTADAAVKEAQETAQHTVTAAQEQARALVADAEAKARQMISDAEAEARHSADETRQRIAEEIITLEETRDALKADHGILERHLEEQRLRLRSSIGDLQRLLDDPARLRAASAPELSGVTRPAFLIDEPVAANQAETVDDGAVIDLDAPADDAVPSAPQAGDVVSERPITGGVSFAPPDDSERAAAPSMPGGGVAVATDEDGDDEDGAWSRFVRQEMLDRPTAAVNMEHGDDAYLTELRKAMLDDTSAGSDLDQRRARPRFGRRR